MGEPADGELLMASLIFTNPFHTHLALITLFLCGLALSYLFWKKTFLVILQDIRPLRIVYYNLLVAFGFLLALRHSQFEPSIETYAAAAVLAITSIFAALTIIITNNIADIDIDKISNKDRPLVASKIDIKTYKRIAWASLFLAMLYSYSVSHVAFFITLFGIVNYSLYSMPPIRLKRVPVFSKFIISINSLLAAMLGFTLINPHIQDFPWPLAAYLLVVSTLLANFIDLKDYEGDKQTGIRTLPVIFGLKRSKKIIGVAFMLAHLSVYFLIQDLSIVALFFLFGLLQFFLITRKNYIEKPVFSILLIALAIFIIYV